MLLLESLKYRLLKVWEHYIEVQSMLEVWKNDYVWLGWGNQESFRIYIFNNDEKLLILEIDYEISLSWKGILYSYNFLSLWHLTTVSINYL